MKIGLGSTDSVTLRPWFHLCQCVLHLCLALAAIAFYSTESRKLSEFQERHPSPSVNTVSKAPLSWSGFIDAALAGCSK